MGTGSEQISAPIAGKTMVARCLSPFSTVFGIHRPKKGTGTVGIPETAAKQERDGASPHFRTPGLQFEFYSICRADFQPHYGAAGGSRVGEGTPDSYLDPLDHGKTGSGAHDQLPPGFQPCPLVFVYPGAGSRRRNHQVGFPDDPIVVVMDDTTAQRQYHKALQLCKV